MKKIVLEIFQREIERQCKFSVIAINEIHSGLKQGDSDKVWYAIQNLLIATGNISKIFWPSYQKLEKDGKRLEKEGNVKEAERLLKKAEELGKRGAGLRGSLGVKDDSPLNPRKFRNHFEHFDERLESWAVSSRRRNFVDSNIGPSNMIVGIDPEDYLRNFDNTTWTLTFRGDKYELGPIIDAIIQLHKKASIEADKPWWK